MLKKLNTWKGYLMLMVSLLLIIPAIYFVFRQQQELVKTIPERHPQTSEIIQELHKAYDSAFLNNPSGGIRIADSGLFVSRKISDSLSMVRFMLRKAACYQMLDRADSTLSAFRASLLLAEKINNASLIAKCRNGLANYYLRKEEYRQAFHQLTEALKAAEKAGDRHATGLIYNGLGLVNVSLNKPGIALEFFRKGRDLCRETGDLTNEAGINQNIANCLAEQGQLNKALEFYGQHLTILQRINDSSQIVLALINLASVHRQLGNYSESFRNLEQAFKSLDEYPDQSLLCTALIEKGNTCLAAGKPEDSRNYFSQSLKLSSGTLSRSNRAESLAGLSEVAESEGNYREALRYFKRLSEVKDSIMNDETRRSISEIQMKNDILKKEYENKLLTGKYELQRKRSLYVGKLAAAIVLLLVLTLILAWVSRKNLKKNYLLKKLQNEVLLEKYKTNETISRIEKQRFRDELEAKTKELTSISLQLVSKNKILSDISAKIAESHNSGAMNRQSYNDLHRIIRENQNADKEWDHFKELFGKVHADFFSGLKHDYPELTENELRLCAYLRINLRNKEISKILNVSPATVVTSRYRIRKKMNLDNKTVLEEFLRNY